MGGQGRFKHANEKGKEEIVGRIQEGELKGKERQVYGFWIAYVVDCI
jgi:hypothetical protein